MTGKRCGYIFIYKIRSTAGKGSNPPAGHILNDVYIKYKLRVGALKSISKG
jgi:hypothetical protein